MLANGIRGEFHTGSGYQDSSARLWTARAGDAPFASSHSSIFPVDMAAEFGGRSFDHLVL
jgi:hypothetical protein